MSGTPARARTYRSAAGACATRWALRSTKDVCSTRRRSRSIAETEERFYEHLGLAGHPPELREGEDEIAAAERGDLPTLVSATDIRGDLHMHSTWSDGRDTIDQMVFASLRLGYEYVAITDHSERALSSRQLAAADIARQRADIDKVRARVKRVEVLHGIEVDIMPDGSLDFDDEQLAGFDIVLASLHDHAGHDGAC